MSVAADSRVLAAREYLAERKYTKGYEICKDLLAYAEGRLEINVGLINENSALKAKLRAPEKLDLSSVSSTELLAELQRRLQE